MPRWLAMAVSALCVMGKMGFLPFTGVLRTPKSRYSLRAAVTVPPPRTTSPW